MLYESLTINLDDLLLDTKNPRFIIPPNASQKNIIEYLVQHENVIELAHGINKNHSLFAGERIIAIKENNRYVVLEGNRRICACKILMNPELIRNVQPASIANIITFDETKKNIKYINVDVMPDRTQSQSSLAAKHIDGIKKWSPISKYKYFANSFDTGKSIDEIAQITGVTKSKIIAGIKEYRKINYILNLPLWTNEEKEKYLDLHNIKANRVLRLFNTKTNDCNNPRLREILGIKFDENNYNIIHSIEQNHFDKILYIISCAAFIPNYCPNFNGTRSTYEDIPILMEYLINNNLLSKSEQNYEDDITSSNSNSSLAANTKPKDVIPNITKIPKASNNVSDTNSKSTDNQKSSKTLTSQRNTLIPENFLVNCNSTKINNIICELKALPLSKYVNAIALLLRTLIELSQKYYLTSIQQEEKIREKELANTYTNTLQIMLINNVIDKNEHSNLVNLKKENKIFNIFNGYTHFDTVLPNKYILINYFDNLSNYLKICLNV